MFELIFREAAGRIYKKLEKPVQNQLKKKILQLKQSCYLGKRLSGYPYWSLRVGNYRVIYEIYQDQNRIEIFEILERKHDYRELSRIGK